MAFVRYSALDISTIGEGRMEILIADDDLHSIKFISYLLEDRGYLVSKAYDGPSVLHMIARRRPDLVLLGVVLPKMNGFEICRQIRRTCDVPLIFLSCRSQVEERVMGLRIGADDYIVKPFEPAELLVRIEAVLRRCRYMSAPGLRPISLGGVTLIPIEHTIVFNDERTIKLTPIEFRLLYFLMVNAGHVLNTQQILTNVWGDMEDWSDNSLVTTYIRRLRVKVEPDATKPRRIVTVRNMGYKFEA
jgi:DNA-binding response OmpR family regulator